MTVCPACRTVQPDQATFCALCGGPLSQEVAYRVVQRVAHLGAAVPHTSVIVGFSSDRAAPLTFRFEPPAAILELVSELRMD